jgi:acyl-CoA reductase-like NAD-dependent aldehyde dehydrogenase
MSTSRPEFRERYPLWVGGRPEQPNADLEVFDKSTGELFARVALADEDTIDRAIGAEVEAAPAMAALPAYERQRVLSHCVRRVQERSDELALGLCIENGKPIRDARGEVTRLVDTLRVAAEESVRQHGEVLTLDISPRAHGYRGFTRRVPLGPVSLIAPFNFPLNLVAHKIAPALAVGCPFVLKPSSRTPVGALILGEILAECDLPEGAFSILPCGRDGARLFTEDPRLKLLSFTGSPASGWDLKSRAGKKRVVLELGGNAAVVVDEDADVDDAVARIRLGAFSQAGQSCISVQRVLVHERVYDLFRNKLVQAARSLVVGDPKDEKTDIGPLISENEAERLMEWIEQAKQAGGRVLCGGERSGAVLHPTVLENVPRHLPLCAKEAFGPVALLDRFSHFDEALDMVNDSRYGLQAGVFTRDLYRAQRAWDRLEVGGVIVGDIPSWRVDHMPYGGVKDSGLGREGLRYAMEDMTELRLLVVRDPGDRPAGS